MSNNKFCYNCGKIIEDKWTYCKHCGTVFSVNNDNNDEQKNITENAIKNNKKNTKIKKKKKIFIVVFLLLIVFAIIILNNYTSLDKVKKSVVKIITYDTEGNSLSTGSGFCVFEKNKIVTNFHVIEGASQIEIQTDNNEIYKINSIDIFNYNQDIAILSGDFSLSPLKTGSIDFSKEGDKITAITSPEGNLNTVSTGVISNLNYEYDILITAPISPRK